MTKWHVILGNHDYQGTGRPEAQIEYTRTDPRWSLPSPYYMRTEHLADGTSADFFFLDTSSYIQHYYRPGSKVHVDRTQPEPQFKWLEHALATSQAAWKIVVGHHQVFAVTAPGDYVGDDMIKRFKPLLDQYGVQAYINGHEHNLQHIRQGRVNYITCGAGSQTDPVQAPPGNSAAAVTVSCRCGWRRTRSISASSTTWATRSIARRFRVRRSRSGPLRGRAGARHTRYVAAGKGLIVRRYPVVSGRRWVGTP